ncbi:hypothetical protein IAQ61_005002 [Plenodomus lingam]|uniref:uncharacterized protein n=1 Tax=Leptosphaeria maculans TaxID=5022 RepID=UPI0033210963|nr:hypothetical protein IAQ61_005002 [Plenodomus lingam]
MDRPSLQTWTWAHCTGIVWTNYYHGHVGHQSSTSDQGAPRAVGLSMMRLTKAATRSMQYKHMLGQGMDMHKHGVAGYDTMGMPEASFIPRYTPSRLPAHTPSSPSWLFVSHRAS